MRHNMWTCIDPTTLYCFREWSEFYKLSLKAQKWMSYSDSEVYEDEMLYSCSCAWLLTYVAHTHQKLLMQSWYKMYKPVSTAIHHAISVKRGVHFMKLGLTIRIITGHLLDAAAYAVILAGNVCKREVFFLANPARYTKWTHLGSVAISSSN